MKIAKLNEINESLITQGQGENQQVTDQINKNTPIIALTATATPKVQQDILKNLKINGL